MIIILLTQFFMIPMEISVYSRPFKVNFTQNYIWKKTRLICDIIYIMDVLMTFFTGYCDHKNKTVIMNPKKIAW